MLVDGIVVGLRCALRGVRFFDLRDVSGRNCSRGWVCHRAVPRERFYFLTCVMVVDGIVAQSEVSLTSRCALRGVAFFDLGDVR